MFLIFRSSTRITSKRRARSVEVFSAQSLRRSASRAFSRAIASLNVAAPVRSAPGPGELALQPPQPRLLARGQAGAVQQLPGGQGRATRPRPGRRRRPRRCRAPGSARGSRRTRHASGRRGRGSPGTTSRPAGRAGPAEPHPPHLRDLHLGVLRYRRRTSPGLTATIRKPSSCPALRQVGPAVRAVEEVRHGLGEVPQRLLLHDDGPGGEPGVVRSGLGQLPALFGEPGHLPAPGPVLVFLLHAQVPHVAGVRAVPHQHRFLLRRRLKTVPRHANIIARNSGEGSAVRNSLPCSARHWFPSRPADPSLRGRH